MDVQFIGLTKLGEDIVRGLSKVDDPSLVHRIADTELLMKRWRGEIDGEKVNVYESVQMTRHEGGKLLVFTNLRIRGSEEYMTADWVRNPKMDNSKGKHDKNSGHCKF